MGQTATSPRVLSGAEEFDRRMRSIAQAQNAHTDAMAELARLVGHSDPFATPPEPGLTVAAETPSIAAVDPGEEPGAPVEPAVVHNTVDPETWERIVSQYPSITPKDEPVPDQWALALDDELGPVASGPVAAPSIVAVRDAPAPELENSRRTLTVLAAVVVLTAGGLGASFLARPGGSAMATATAAPPTIMAATGPTKIQPDPPADAPSEPSTLLDKSGSDGTAAAKVVNTVEQPVDLSQAVKPAAPSVTADAQPARPSAFPEPRKVRTVMVRPDGSIMADSTPSAAAVPADANAQPDAQQASLAFDPKTTLPPPPAAHQPSAVEAALAARPAPPADPATPLAELPARTPSGKTTARATSRAAASTSQDGAAQARSPVATPKSKPAHAAAKPKPADEAPAADAAPTQVAAADPAPATQATDATPTSAVGGSFAIQLGAAQSQAEGDAAAARLAQKFGADLNGATPVVRKAQAGGKTVFRIRVGNLSQDGAKALCAKVQAGGGGCFVARN